MIDYSKIPKSTPWEFKLLAETYLAGTRNRMTVFWNNIKTVRASSASWLFRHQMRWIDKKFCAGEIAGGGSFSVWQR
jgi:hypothetical protein